MVTIRREPIAVVGIGCRLPGGVNNAKAFWDTLCNGISKISEVPADRFDSASFYDENDPRKYGAIRNCKGGFVKDIYSFDADFFGYYPTEASVIDPQQRLALEASVHALEDSGTTLEQVAGTRTGVFMGNFISDHLALQSSPNYRDNLGAHLAMGTSNCAIANRVSHRLNLQGPSLTMDTACSSSLVSLHVACQSIWAHDCDAALAGGVNAILRPESTILMSKAGFLSPDGMCKSFDAAANGYVRSEGVGIVYLKPVSKALADKDRIYAVVRGSLINQDGYTPEGFTVPSLKAQSTLLRSLYAQTGVDPTHIRYVEAHGPGTVVGDPIEANALGQQLGQMRSSYEDPLWIGSLKGNFGHLEGAAGISGFIKATLIAFHRAIPPQLNHVTPNPAIDFKSLRLAVPLKMVDMTQDRRVCVGVNSFGAGGTNAHAVLEEPPRSASTASSSHGPRVFILSGRSPSAMEDTARELAMHLRHDPLVVDDVAYTLNMRRGGYSHTSIIPANGIDELCSRLDMVASGHAPKEILTLQKRVTAPTKIAFVFSGQGGQWLDMGISLADQEGVFRDSLHAFDALFTPRAGFSVLAQISSHDDPSRLNKTTIVQPAIAAIQIALARMLISYGITPSAIAGHSIGEVAAAHIAGALTLEQAVEVIYLRASIQSKASGNGSMLAAGISAAEAETIIARRECRRVVEIATFNGPEMTTLAGDTKILEQLAEELGGRGKFARFVNVEVPYHSRFMDPLEDELVRSLSKVQSSPTDITLYSTVTTVTEPGTHLNGRYWFENVRKPVRYVETASNMLAAGCNFFVEIGPHPVLVSGTRAVAEKAKLPVHIFPGMVRGNDTEPLSRLIGAAHALGVGVDIEAYNGGGGCVVDLPLYPFQRQHYWSEHPQAQQRRIGNFRHPFLEGSNSLTDDGRGTLSLRLNTGVSPFLSEHVVDGTMVFPMTGHLEAAYLAAHKHLLNEPNICLEDLRFEHPIVLASAEEFAPQAVLEITSPAKDYVIATRSAASTGEDAWQVCSRGRISSGHLPKHDPEGLQNARRVESGTEIDVTGFYRILEESGLRYGAAFRGIQKMWRLGNEIFSHVQLPVAYQAEAARFKFHPALLDACCHGMFADIHHYGDPRTVYLPYHMEQVRIYNEQPVISAFTHITMTSRDETFIRCDASIYSETGQCIATFKGLSAKRLEGQSLTVPREYQICFQSESSQPNIKRVNVDYLNIIVLKIPGSDSLLSTIQRAFPSAAVHQVDIETVDAEWDKGGWGFALEHRTLIVLPALVSPVTGHINSSHIDSSHSNIYQTVESIFGALMRVASWIHQKQGCPAFIVLTRGGSMTPVDSQCDPVSSSIEAAMRVMVNEFPHVRMRIVDLALGDMGDTAMLEEELRTIRLGRDDLTVAIRQEGRFFKEIRSVDVDDEKRATKLLPARGGSYVCERDTVNNSLDGIIVREQLPTDVGPDDVEIEVHAAGLNFKDVMNGLGLLTERATSGALTGRELGLEVAGRVVKTGSNVQGIATGSSVMARVSSGLVGRAVTNKELVTPVPASLTMAEAASIPIAYLTAYYALVYLGRIARGESVLIHSAAGGVGIAAVQIAKLFGARVFGTAGSAERRSRVLEMGVEAVFDSRSPSFKDEVKKATGGAGVDLVLNSLTGPMFAQSVASLAPFGRLLEIGKTDIYRNMRLGLEQFGDNRSFFAVDIDRLALQRPHLHRRMMDDVYRLFESRQLMPPPVTTYPVAKLSTALNALSRSGVVGKVAVEMTEDAYVNAAPPTRLQLTDDKSYLITGGTAGLGSQVARFLADRGARHLVLVSRSGPKTAEDRAMIVDLRQRGVAVHVELVDVNSCTDITSLFDQKRDWPRIAGVLHCAGVVQDVFSHESTMGDFWNVYGPKAIGAWNLHLATKDKELEFFVMMSSVSGVMGGTATFSYSAANQFVDSLAHHRRACGLPALALNLGVLGNFAGMVQSYLDPRQLLADLAMQGLSPLSLPTVLSVLERTMIQGTTQRLSLGVDFSQYLKTYPHLARNGIILQLGSELDGLGASGSSSVANLGIDKMADILRSGLAKIVGLDPARVSIDERIEQYAFDSLTLTQLRGVILREFGVTFPLMRLFQGPSLQQIAEELYGLLSQGAEALQGSTVKVVDSQADASLPDGLSVLSPWFIQGRGVGRRIICFHAMGAAASWFNPYLLDPPKGIDPIAVQLPGRENRADEPIPASLSTIIDDIVRELDQLEGPAPELFWGQSLGGIIAFEVIRALRRKGKPLPRLLITSTIAPQLAVWMQRRELFLRMSAEEYSADYLLAVTPNIQDADFGRSILPTLRNDAPLLLDYRYEEEGILDIPITAVVARQDDIVYPDEVEGWGVHTKQFKLVEMDGDHWSVRVNKDSLWETIMELMAEGA